MKNIKHKLIEMIVGMDIVIDLIIEIFINHLNLPKEEVKKILKHYFSSHRMINATSIDDQVEAFLSKCMKNIRMGEKNNE